MAGDSPVVREDPEVKLEGDERLGALETGEDGGGDAEVV